MFAVVYLPAILAQPSCRDINGMKQFQKTNKNKNKQKQKQKQTKTKTKTNTKYNKIETNTS
jgi:hypothetical protein